LLVAVNSHLLVARNRHYNQLISGKPRLYWVLISGTMLAYIQAAISATLPAIQAIGWRFFYVAKPTRRMGRASYNFCGCRRFRQRLFRIAASLS
jgi:hypothetical protein